MCLYLKELIKHKATSNIYVWKALVSFPNYYCSPVFKYNYTLGKLYKSNLQGRELHSELGCTDEGLYSVGYNVKIHNSHTGYSCWGSMGNGFIVRYPIDTIGLCMIPEGSHYYTDGYFYVSDTLKFLRTLTVNEFFNYMINR